MPTKILIVTRSFQIGGAQRQLLAFLQHADRDRLEIAVACFYREGWHEEALTIPLVAVHDLGKRSRYDVIGPGRRLWRLTRAFRPQVVYGYHGAALPALVVGKMSHAAVAWAIRNSEPVPVLANGTDRLLAYASGRCSRAVDGFIANSESGAAAYGAYGYPKDRIVVIPNGVDLDRFAHSEALRQETRSAWQVPADAVLVGLVGRLDRRKNHGDFLRAAAAAREGVRDLRIACIGGMDGAYRDELRALASDLGIADLCLWLPHQDNVAATYSALDICVLPSLVEGFPNTLCEAMACEVAVVASDAGDCRMIVGDAGRVVSRGDVQELAEAIRSLAQLTNDQRREIGHRARARIAGRFGMKRMVDATTSCLERLASAH